MSKLLPDEELGLPPDFKTGLRKHYQFHGKDPNDVGVFSASFQIPTRIGLVGKALFSAYRCSKKHGTDAPGRVISYHHDHEGGTRVYKISSRTTQVVVPAYIRNAETLVRLGTCVGVAYADPEGNEYVGLDDKRSDLFCTPNGHALLVVTDRRKLEVMIWGGRLRVLEKGIVG